MGRILALDYGRKRTGVAVSDTLRLVANGLKTVPTGELDAFLEAYFKQEKVDIVVVGQPKQMNNQPSESMVYIEPFVKRLKKKYPEISVEYYDERFTSMLAQRAMIDGGVKKKDRQNKALTDLLSATIILQSYMESVANYKTI